MLQQIQSVQDKMYRGLQGRKSKTFPVHQSLRDMILSEWKEPERRLFQSKRHKRRFPFQSEFEETFFKCPRLDAPMSQVSKRSDLSFEDSGVLKEQMDRKADSLLRKAWYASALALGPAVASTCVARNLDVCVQRLDDLLSSDTPPNRRLGSLSHSLPSRWPSWLMPL